MADQLNMGALNLGNDANGPRSYIPPHMRGKMGPANGAPAGPPMAGPPPGANGLNNSAWAGYVHQPFSLQTISEMLTIPSNAGFDAHGPPPAGGPPGGWNTPGDFPPPGAAPAPPQPNQWGAGGGARQGGGGFNPNAYGNPSRGGNAPSAGGGGGGGGGYARGSGDGQWRDGKHIPGPANQRLERDLFGTPDDSSKQHSGINFEKYDDIPVEASGHDVPEPLLNFTNPPLDDHLISNIKLARYTVPTPVQKYSVPIVMGGRDLMACAQTGSEIGRAHV